MMPQYLNIVPFLHNSEKCVEENKRIGEEIYYLRGIF